MDLEGPACHRTWNARLLAEQLGWTDLLVRILLSLGQTIMLLTWVCSVALSEPIDSGKPDGTTCVIHGRQYVHVSITAPFGTLYLTSAEAVITYAHAEQAYAWRTSLEVLYKGQG